MTQQDVATVSPSRRGKVVLALLFLFSLAGVGVSLQLTYVYHEANRDLTHVSHCHISAQWDCDNVARSEYAHLLGVPVALWGVVSYLFMAFLVGRGLFGAAPPHWPLGVLGALLVGAIGMTAYLMYASFVILQKKCLWCAVLYGVNGSLLLIWGVALFFQRLGPVSAFRRDLVWLVERLRLFGTLVGVGLALVAVALLVGPRLGRRGEAPSPLDVDALVKAPSRSAPGSRPAAHPGSARVPLEPPTWLGEMVGPHTPALGPRNADLYIVEFSDYQCPFCQMSNRVMERVIQKYGKRIRLYHHHFPLDRSCFKKMRYQMHDHACFAAAAAICAGRQGKFWAFHDAQFRLGRGLAPRTIRALARRMGLVMARFESCLTAAATKKTIQADLSLGVRLKVMGTPTYFIGGGLVKRFQPRALSLELFDRLFAAIDKARRQATLRARAVPAMRVARGRAPARRPSPRADPGALPRAVSGAPAGAAVR